MKQIIILVFVALFSFADTGYGQTIPNIPGVKGDGIHDDTQGIQALLDSKAATVYLPQPPKNYLISKTLKIHSGQTLIADRNAVIRLADHAGAHLLTNADHAGGNERITVTGGIWDGNNLTQTTLYHQNRKNKDIPYDPNRYIGVLMQFDNVKDLHIANVTFKDPEMFAFIGGNLLRFTIENITFDFNLRRGNMDGIHIAGNSHQGRIVNLKGATNDDLVALNADDVPLVELSRGPITDIQVDGIWAEHAHRAVRLNSCGSPVKRIKISNVHGTYIMESIILANHKVHPEIISTFEDISINGLFSSNSTKGGRQPHIRIHSPAQVSNLTITDYHRTEEASATDSILVEKGAHIEYLSVSNATLNNKSKGAINFINNLGTIETLHLSNIFLQGKTDKQKVQLINNKGEIKSLNKTNVSEKSLTNSDNRQALLSSQEVNDDATRVVPIRWENFAVSREQGKDEKQSRLIFLNTIRYNLGWISQSLKKDEQRQLYIFNRYREWDIRPSASVCYAAAVALKCAKPNEKELGVSPDVALERIVALIRGLAVSYKGNRTDGKGWGYVWQSASWAALAGHGAWMLWDNLDKETQALVQTMVIEEANRFILPNYRVPYWTAPNGHVNTPGDTKAEENAWNAEILQLAIAMMPEHPNGDAWKRVCCELMISSFALKSDLKNTQIVDGKPVKDWLHGYNVRDDGAVVNHKRIHPDYMMTIALKTRSYIVQPLALQPVFEGASFNLPFIYRSFTEHVWKSPPYDSPGGTMYIPGKAELYYPQGTDWSKYRFDIYYLLDVNVHLLGLDKELKHKAIDWLRIRADRIEAMQARHKDGKMYAPKEFTTYPGCEQMAAWQLADAYLFFWLHSRKAITGHS